MRHFVIERVFGGDDDHARLMSLLLDLAQDVQATTSRKHQVEQDAIIFIDSDPHQCLATGKGLFATIIILTEVADDAV